MKSDFEKFIEENENNFTKFWKEEYPKLSLDEKKKYWLTSTHKGMRTQGEAFGDEYSVFLKNGMILPMSMNLNLMKFSCMLLIIWGLNLNGRNTKKELKNKHLTA